MKNELCRIITIILLISYALFIHVEGRSQHLKIGEKCPDLIIKNVINYDQEEIKLSHTKPKLILLDFWAPICVSCIEAFPHIDSLQQKFGDKVLIATVSETSKDVIQQFFKRRPFIKMPSVPFITGDSILHKLFEPKFYPWHVWLDSNLVVRYITDGSNATKENIQGFLDGKDINLYQLVDLQQKPILNNDTLLKYYSYIAPCVPGTFKASQNGVVEGNKIFFTRECTTIPDFVMWVLGKIDSQYYDYKYPLIIEAANKDKFFNTNKLPKNIWLKENSFSYYLMLPLEKKNSLYKFALSDIERHFNINVLKGKRSTPCLILSKMENYKSLRSKGGTPINELKINTIKNPAYSKKRYLQNHPFEVFANKLQTWTETLTKLPFIDETDIDYNVDISLNGDALDSWNLDRWNIELGKYGLTLIQENRMTDTIVIQEL